MRSLRQLAQTDRFADVVRVFLALSGIVVWCTLVGPADAIVPALLGAIACALAETDDAWRGRLRGLIVTLICFAAAGAVVEASIGIPPVFAVVLPVGTFLLVMLGAASGRYATIATATLILSVYTMIASDASSAATSGHSRASWAPASGTSRRVIAPTANAATGATQSSARTRRKGSSKPS